MPAATSQALGRALAVGLAVACQCAPARACMCAGCGTRSKSSSESYAWISIVAASSSHPRSALSANCGCDGPSLPRPCAAGTTCGGLGAIGATARALAALGRSAAARCIGSALPLSCRASRASARAAVRLGDDARPFDADGCTEHMLTHGHAQQSCSEIADGDSRFTAARGRDGTRADHGGGQMAGCAAAE